MTSVTTAFPPQDATDEIGRPLADDGYVTGPDGQAVASRLREPPLRDTLVLGCCNGTNDISAFFRRDEEPAEERMVRREHTIACHERLQGEYRRTTGWAT